MSEEYSELISIIIPVYNVEKYLDKCVQSILKQTYRHLEIILIDDGSTDRSSQICDRLGQEHENIRVIHNNNQGPAASRKYGIEHAKGDLVMFVDSDDWINVDMVEVLYQEMQISASDIATCTYQDIYNNGRIIMHQPFKEEAIECISFAEYIYHIHGTRYLQTGPIAKLYKKKLFENVDFREHITIGEDYTMLLQVMKNASKVRMIKSCLYNRGVYGGNISRSGYTERHKQALDNYLAVRNGLTAVFPEYENEILGYHIEYEMAVITAMCRNRNFDSEVIQKLKNDLRKNMKKIIMQCHMPLYMKGCAFMIAYCAPLFVIIFSGIHLLAGR